MTWDVIVQMLMEAVETDIVETDVLEIEIVVIEDAVPEVVLIELVVVQLEFALLNGTVPRYGSLGHSPLPAK